MSSELLILTTPEGEKLLEQYIGMNHTTVALKSRNAVLATAIKYLDKARYKLPTWYKARAIIDSQLFEQCSSEATAIAKFQGITSGKSSLDLTCGLGVDSWAISQHFTNHTTVEIDPTKAEIARCNFKKLGADNIEVINSSAEEYCQMALNEGKKFDLIYSDPSRVARLENGEIKKVYSLEDSSPNILELLPTLRLLSNNIIVKLSPLFDIEECYRVFGSEIEVEIVATTTECKEVLVKIKEKQEQKEVNIAPIVRHTIVTNSGSNSFTANYRKAKATEPEEDFEPKFLYIPNVALYKSRCIESYTEEIIGKQKFYFSNYIFTAQRVESDNFQAQEFEIVESMNYSPKLIKSELKQRGIKQATLYIKGFSYSQQQIAKELKIKEGGNTKLLLTNYNNTPRVFIIKQIR